MKQYKKNAPNLNLVRLSFFLPGALIRGRFSDDPISAVTGIDLSKEIARIVAVTRTSRFITAGRLGLQRPLSHRRSDNGEIKQHAPLHRNLAITRVTDPICCVPVNI
ncbi:hypothetical protein CEXT_485881 [Caerostris extrusa]|uniref:Uncharacterized protein n=1 Tax=Caerostris extrusa TaxID=172846 RepID=A0AAV4MMA4_CAEEX|nr:hypothetical protein CEXT_485881 [Caerostris extrusa]